MAFDFATIEKTFQKQPIATAPADPIRDAGLALENPDRALAFLFVAQADNGMIAAILAA